MEFTIKEAALADYEGIKEIYAQGIESGTATFRTKIPEYEEWDKSHLPFCRYIAQIGELTVGWTSLTLGLTRGAYRGVAELSIYVRDGYRRHGIGFALIEEVKKTRADMGYGCWNHVFAGRIRGVSSCMRSAGFGLWGIGSVLRWISSGFGRIRWRWSIGCNRGVLGAARALPLLICKIAFYIMLIFA